MAVPGAPTNLSAEATNSTTAILQWSTPEDDGGETIDGYQIERSLEGVILSIAVDDAGSGYTIAPAVTITGGGGTGATASTIIGGVILNATLGGDPANYSNGESITISGGSGINATGNASFSGNTITSVNVTDGGSGYAIDDVLTITGDSSGTATATLTVDALDTLLSDNVTSITIVLQGNGYTSAPDVTIAAPSSGTTATAFDPIISDDSFSVLVANTGDDSTTHTDSTLFARNNPTYRVSAINSDGTGDPFNTASTTTPTSEAQTISELLFNEWSLTGELSKEVVGNMNEVVQFFDRGQIPGNKVVKAVTVQKINELGNENIVEHPKFFEQSDTFEVTCFIQVTDGATDVFSVWIDLMQQMTGEVSRILKTVFSPSSTTGEFFTTNTGWTKDDTFFPDDPMLVRTLRFTLTRIVSTSEEVFLGFGGVLLFSFAQSDGDSLPTRDYLYTQVERVQIVQGWRNLPYITTSAPLTTAIPIYYRGAFSGRFSCNMQLKKSDITPSTLNSLSQIFLPQSNGELGTAVFFHITPNTETFPSFLTESVSVNITNVEKIAENEQLVSFSISGNLTGPTSIFITGNMLYQNTGNMEYETEDNMGYG